MAFVNGDQWKDDAKSRRYRRPTEVINDSIVNKRKVREEYKKRQASVKVRAIDSGSDRERAELYNAVYKSIQRESMAEEVMDLAFDDMLSCGMGFCHVDTEHESEDSFDQKITVNDIEDPFSVFFDTNCKKLDMSDAEFGGFLYSISRKEYEKQYPEAQPIPYPEYDSNVMYTDGDNICLCRYYKADYVDDTLVAVPSPDGEGTINICLGDIDDAKYEHYVDYLKQTIEDYDRENLLDYVAERTVAKRQTEKRIVTVYILNGDDVLESEKWNGRYIPIIPMLGDRYLLNDDKYYWSLVRSEKSPARIYNYALSNSLEKMSAQPIAPFMGPAQIFKGHEHIWASANQKPMPYLPYSPLVTEDGQTVNVPPIPMSAGEIPSSWASMLQISGSDKYKCSGLQEDALGGRGNVVSARAVTERAENSLQTVTVFFERRKFATQLLGRVITDLMPAVYDTRRVVKIMGDDGKENSVLVNAQNTNGPYKGKIFSLKDAKLDVYVDVGPSRESRRKDDQAIAIEMMRETPDQYKPAIISHLWSTVDGQNVDKIIENINKLQPASLQPEDMQAEEKMKAEFAQLKQQNEQLVANNEQLNQMLMAEQTKAQARLQEADMKIRGDLQKEALKQRSETEREMISSNTDLAQARIETGTDLEQTKIESQTDIQVEMIKHMQALSAKVDALSIRS